MASKLCATENYEMEVIESGLYSVNSAGVCFSLKRKKKRRLRGTLNGSGYAMFKAYLNGEKKCVYVHRFVWCFFKGEIPPGKEIWHRNRNRADNRIENLELTSVTADLTKLKQQRIELLQRANSVGRA